MNGRLTNSFAVEQGLLKSLRETIGAFPTGPDREIVLVNAISAAQRVVGKLENLLCELRQEDTN